MLCCCCCCYWQMTNISPHNDESTTKTRRHLLLLSFVRDGGQWQSSSFFEPRADRIGGWRWWKRRTRKLLVFAVWEQTQQVDERPLPAGFQVTVVKKRCVTVVIASLINALVLLLLPHRYTLSFIIGQLFLYLSRLLSSRAVARETRKNQTENYTPLKMCNSHRVHSVSWNVRISYSRAFFFFLLAIRNSNDSWALAKRG